MSLLIDIQDVMYDKFYEIYSLLINKFFIIIEISHH